MFVQTQNLIFLLVFFNLKDSLVTCGYSKCLKLPYHYTQLTLYKNEVNVPTNLKTSVKISEDGERVVVFEFEIPQNGQCFWREQVCLTSQYPQEESYQKYNNQSIWFVLPFHNFLRTYKVTSLAYDRDIEYSKYTWTSADQCAILFQEEEDHSLCLDFKHALVLKEKETFLTDTYDFKSILLQPGCHLMQYIVGDWHSVEKDGMFDFSEEMTQYYCHCEHSNKFELGVTTVFPPDYKAERITSMPWVWDDGTDIDPAASETVAASKSWETNAVLFLSEDENSVFIIKGVLIIVMAIAVVDTLILGVYIWLGVENSWD